MAWWKDTVAVAAPAFAALAAGASWVSVAQSRRVITLGARPNLQVQRVSWGQSAATLEADEWAAQAIYVVHNAGGGLAKGTGFVFASGEEYVAGFLEFGFVRSGDTYNVRTAMRTAELQPPTIGVVMCHDVEDRSYVWDLRGGPPRRFRMREKPSLADVFHETYPDMNLDSLRAVGSSVQRVTEPL
jgi:hypothetical protein